MTELLIGRQPIFNRALDVIGYELLYRTPQSPNRSVITDGDVATINVLFNSFSLIGLENLVGRGIGYVNITENFLTGKYSIPFPPEKLALEVLENINITREVIASLSSLWQQGYQIVLDDIKDVEKVQPLLNVARIVKLDLPQIRPVDLPEIIRYLKQLGVKLVAEKVETLTQFKHCQQMGFDYFQGYFLYKPHVVRTQRIDSSRAVIMHTLSQINNPQLNFKDLEEFISRDVTITYKLLRLVNSAYYSNRVTIRSVRQAISMVGIERLKGWLTLLLVTSTEHKPNELTVTAITRAKFCELLATAQRIDSKHLGIYFVTGLFSLMDVFMNMTLDKAIHGLPLSEEIVDALLFGKGNMGRVLKAVIAYERADLTNALELNLSAEAITHAYVNTLQWVNALKDSMELNTNEPVTVN